MPSRLVALALGILSLSQLLIVGAAAGGWVNGSAPPGGAKVGAREDGQAVGPTGVFVRLVPASRDGGSDLAAVYFVAEVGGEVLVGGDHGLCRMQGDLCRAIEVPGRATIRVIEAIDGAAWVGTSGGLMRLEGDRLAPQFEDVLGRIGVNAIADFAGATWVGTSRGLVSFGRNGPSPGAPRLVGEPIASQEIHALLATEEALWVGGGRNAYRIDRAASEPRPVFADAAEVAGFFAVGESRWAIEIRNRMHHCFRIEGDAPVPVLSPPEVLTIREVEGQAWFGTTTGVLLEDGTTPFGVTIPRVPVAAIEVPREGEVWLGTERVCRDGSCEGGGVFVRAGRQTRPIQGQEGQMSVDGLVQAGGSMWAWSTAGAYRWDEGVDILEDLTTWPGPCFGVVLGSTLDAQFAYFRDGLDPYDDAVIEKRFHWRVGCSFAGLNEGLRAPAGVPRKVPMVCAHPFVEVRDAFGNVRFRRPGPFVSTRWWWILAVPWLAGLVVLIAAPWLNPAMRLINFPWPLRDLGSLLSVRVLLLWAFWGRHLLRRYRRACAASELCRRRIEEMPRSAEAAEVLDRAGRSRLTTLAIEADDQTALLRVVECRMARRVVPHRKLRKLLPVYLEVDGEVKKPEDLVKKVTDVLSGLGWITDEALAKWLLKQSYFLLLIACGAKLPPVRSAALRAFQTAHARNRFVVVVSPGLGLPDDWPVPEPVRVSSDGQG